MLIGIALYPAAAVLIFGIPCFAALVNLALLQPEIHQGLLGLFEWMDAPSLLLIPATGVVFIRRAWAHRRPSGDNTLRNLWLGLGVLALGVPISLTALDLGAGNKITAQNHFAGMAAAFVWLSVTLSGTTGAIVSRLLQRHERNQAPD
jgi:hypothetical protein